MKKSWNTPKIVQLNVSETANSNNDKTPGTTESQGGGNTKYKIASHVS